VSQVCAWLSRLGAAGVAAGAPVHAARPFPSVALWSDRPTASARQCRLSIDLDQLRANANGASRSSGGGAVGGPPAGVASPGASSPETRAWLYGSVPHGAVCITRSDYLQVAQPSPFASPGVHVRFRFAARQLAFDPPLHAPFLLVQMTTAAAVSPAAADAPRRPSAASSASSSPRSSAASTNAPRAAAAGGGPAVASDAPRSPGSSRMELAISDGSILLVLPPPDGAAAAAGGSWCLALLVGSSATKGPPTQTHTCSTASAPSV